LTALVEKVNHLAHCNMGDSDRIWQHW